MNFITDRTRFLSKAWRMAKALTRPGTVSGESRRRRLRYMVPEVVCGLVTGGHCWWGKPYRDEYHRERVVRCRICHSVWSNWESSPRGGNTPVHYPTWDECPYDDVREDPKMRAHFEKVCASGNWDPKTAPWNLVYVSLEPPPPEAAERARELAREFGW